MEATCSSAEAIETGKCQRFDFGTANANLEHYNQTTPPQCVLDQMRVPIALFSGSDDWLTVPEDVNLLVPLLPNIVVNQLIDGLTHTDFLFAMESGSGLYSNITRMIRERDTS